MAATSTRTAIHGLTIIFAIIPDRCFVEFHFTLPAFRPSWHQNAPSMG
jgi:hypothetical protein